MKNLAVSAAVVCAVLLGGISPAFAGNKADKKDRIEKRFEKFDTNKDGQLSEAEYRAMCEARKEHRREKKNKN